MKLIWVLKIVLIFATSSLGVKVVLNTIGDFDWSTRWVKKGFSMFYNHKPLDSSVMFWQVISVYCIYLKAINVKWLYSKRFSFNSLSNSRSIESNASSITSGEGYSPLTLDSFVGEKDSIKQSLWLITSAAKLSEQFLSLTKMQSWRSYLLH